MKRWDQFQSWGARRCRGKTSTFFKISAAFFFLSFFSPGLNHSQPEKLIHTHCSLIPLSQSCQLVSVPQPAIKVCSYLRGHDKTRYPVKRREGGEKNALSDRDFRSSHPHQSDSWAGGGGGGDTLTSRMVRRNPRREAVEKRLINASLPVLIRPGTGIKPEREFLRLITAKLSFYIPFFSLFFGGDNEITVA